MRRLKIITPLLLLFTLIFSGCKKEGSFFTEQRPYRSHYIISYEEPPTAVKAEIFFAPITTTVSSISFPEEIPFYDIRIQFYNASGQPLTQITPDRDSARYSELASRFKDVAFNRRSYGFGPSQYKRIVRLEVTSDVDYDLEHPAGTPLNDIVDVEFATAQDYIQSGYQSFQTYLGRTTRPIYQYAQDRPDQELVQLCESLVEFNQIQRALVKFSFTFTFNKAPDQQSPHVFTVRYINEDGRELVASISKPVIVR